MAFNEYLRDILMRNMRMKGTTLRTVRYTTWRNASLSVLESVLQKLIACIDIILNVDNEEVESSMALVRLKPE